MDTEIAKNEKNPTAFSYMQKYKTFISQLVQENTVLDKRFYIVVPYSYLEGGNTNNKDQEKAKSSFDEFVFNAKVSLQTKAEGIRNQLARINLQTKILQKDALITLFTDIYHHTDEQNTESDISIGVQNTV